MDDNGIEFVLVRLYLEYCRFFREVYFREMVIEVSKLLDRI